MLEIQNVEDASRQVLDEPVRVMPLEDEADPSLTGIALCLSGGGYRAMLFHVGAIWRMNEAGLLTSLKRVSSVSGGSMTAGVLGMNWHKLQRDPSGKVVTNLDQVLVSPIRSLASRTIDRGAVIVGALLPGSIHDKVTGSLRKHLFAEKTLADLPSDDNGPRFVINATNVQTGTLWRFSRPYMGDYRIGLIRDPKVSLATAVAASAAFPPVLSPALLDVDPAQFDPSTIGPAFRAPFNEEVYLADGGVYDNLGLETAYKACKTLLVSDGGQKVADEGSPDTDWVRHAARVASLVDNQVRSLRKRQLIDAFARGDRDGAYWGIRTHIADYGLTDALDCPTSAVEELAGVKTRLKAMDDRLQERLINWGYAVCDAAIRRHVNPQLPKPAGFPYARGLV